MKAPMGNGSGAGDFENPPAGSYVGRCVKLIDLGTQDDTWQGEAIKARKLAIFWELGGALMKDGRPFIVIKRFRFSMHKNANLRKTVQSWAGKQISDEQAAGMDLSKLLGTNALLTLTETATGKIVVDSVIRRPEAMPAYPQVNPSQFVALDPAEFNAQAYAELTDYWKGVIAASPEYAAITHKLPPSTGANQKPANADDDIPF